MSFLTCTMEYAGLPHFNPPVGAPSDDILMYGDEATRYVTSVQEEAYDMSENGYVPANQHYGEDFSEPEFRETHSVFIDGGDRFGVCSVAFDQQEELIWMGNQGGHVTSYYGTDMQKHTSFQVHMNQEVRHIATFDDGILALSQNSLRCQMRRGIPIFTHSSDNMQEMQCLLQIGPDTVLLGGHQDKMIEYNLTQGQETAVRQVGNSGCAILRQHGRYICAGDPLGRIELRAPNTLKVEHVLEAHSGSLSDFDVHGNTLVTCGFSTRQGGLSVDRFLMVYDIRMMRAINPIQVMLDPLLLRFLPSFSSRLATVSALGQIQLVDTVAITQEPDLYQVDTGGSMCLTFDVSSSCQCLVVGDSGGSLHLFTANTHTAMFNTYSQETEFADPVEPLPPASIDDTDTPLASVPLPYVPHGSPLLSDWPEDFVQRFFRKTPSIDPEILRTMKMQGTIGYAPNPVSSRRNQVSLKKQEGVAKLPSNDTKVNKYCCTQQFIPIPKRYRKLILNYSKYGLDDLDCDPYNKTSFCGLEGVLPNSYCNSMLQVLYYMSPLRKIFLSHICDREFCLSCEFSLLFHMMDMTRPICQANNFYRTFRSIPDTTLLGLSICEENPRTESTDLISLIQNWHKYVLFRTHQEFLACRDNETVQRGESPTHQFADHSPKRDVYKDTSIGSCTTSVSENGRGDADQRVRRTRNLTEDEVKYLWVAPPEVARSLAMGSPMSPEEPQLIDPHFGGMPNTEDQSPLSRIIGFQQIFRLTCHKCHLRSSTESVHMLLTLTYPSMEERKEYTFCEVLRKSLISDYTIQTWCERCGDYQPAHHSRRLRDLPSLLAVNTGFNKELDTFIKDKVFWQAQMDNVVHKIMTQGPEVHGIKQCRYGDNCMRPGCRFYHPNRPDVPVIGNTRNYYYSNPWVPMHMQMSLTASGNVFVKQLPESRDGPSSRVNPKEEIVKIVNYDLAAVICYIEDHNFEKRNLVALINVASEYHERASGSCASQWYIFNDLSVVPISAQEVVWFNLEWKLPCIMYWTNSSLPDDIVPPVVNPITVDAVLNARTLIHGQIQEKHFTPLLPDEVPRRGDLIAMDAEFVTLNAEDAELMSDGKRNSPKQCMMSVARVSCIRGQGPLEGMAFIDDYISTQEKIGDYLTKFSGILPGDLDAKHTTKHLTTLKSTYMKLRYLADNGVMFVGHGLTNDFRVINISVPADQVLDTVILFKLPQHRMVSLRFLAWYFLGIQIQNGPHDSIEDANAALKLYRYYKRMERNGTLKKSLRRLYDMGKYMHWKVPDDAAIVGHRAFKK